MRGWSFAAVCAALLLAAAPAAAADLAQIGCVEQRIGATEKARFEAGLRREILGLAEMGAERGDRYFEILYDASVACAKEHGWSKEAGDMAFAYADGSIMLGVARRVAREIGMNLSKVEKLWEALPQARRTTLFAEDGSDFAPLLEAAQRDGLIKNNVEANVAAVIFACRKHHGRQSTGFLSGLTWFRPKSVVLPPPLQRHLWRTRCVPTHSEPNREGKQGP